MDHPLPTRILLWCYYTALMAAVIVCLPVIVAYAILFDNDRG